MKNLNEGNLGRKRVKLTLQNTDRKEKMAVTKFYYDMINYQLPSNKMITADNRAYFPTKLISHKNEFQLTAGNPTFLPSTNYKKAGRSGYIIRLT